MYQTLPLRLTGVAPLLMHRGGLADPLDDFARALKAVAKRRNKTDQDIEEAARIEFLGGIYVDDDGAPCLTGEMIEACLMAGARRTKQGKSAAAGLLAPGNYRLIYEGPRSAEALWADPAFRHRTPARIGQSRVIRTRPIFRQWACEVGVEFNADLIDRHDVLRWAQVAGLEIGIGDWRPRHGRFAVEAI